MKKTLLFIIAMAISTILASGGAFAAHSVQKEIAVKAEIAESITMTKTDGSPFNSLKLEYQQEADSQGFYKFPKFFGSQSIKIISRQGGGVRIRLAEVFSMSDINGKNRTIHPDVYIKTKGVFRRLTTTSKLRFSTGHTVLHVVAEEYNAKPGDKYTGTLKFIMESVP